MFILWLKFSFESITVPVGLWFYPLTPLAERRKEEMNKGDLVNEVAKVVGTKKASQDAVDTVFASITKALKKKDTVTLVGFGTFKVDRRKARKGRNPQTGEEIRIKAKRIPKFVAGKALKDAVK
jgi:DNA-binding protein HU-beta